MNAGGTDAKPQPWTSDWDFIQQELPDLPAPFFKLIARERRFLDARTAELIFLVSNSSPSHFFEPGFLHHAREAVAHGATMAKVLSVLAIVATMGTHSVLLGASILWEEAPPAPITTDHQDRVAKIRDRHVELLGPPIPEAERAMHADPAFYGDWLDLAAVCFGPDCALTPRIAHLVAIAASVQCTQPSTIGVRQHVRAALAAGAEAGEILEVCELIVGVGGHTVLMGTPLLMREIAGIS